MPAKPRKSIAGMYRLREFAAEAKKKHDVDISIAGLKRKFQKRELKPDAIEGRRYAASPLLDQQRFEYWLSVAPRKKAALAENEMTTYSLLAQAQQANPGIHLSHVQQFLAQSQANPAHRDHWKQTRIEKHGEQSRLIFPKTLGKIFLDRVRKNELAGLFAGYGRKPGARRASVKKPKTRVVKATQPPPAAKPTPAPIGTRKPRPTLAQPRPYSEPTRGISIESLRGQYPVRIVQSRVATMSRSYPKSVRKDTAAMILGLSTETVQDLAFRRVLKQDNEGKIKMESIQRLANQLV